MVRFPGSVFLIAVAMLGLSGCAFGTLNVDLPAVGAIGAPVAGQGATVVIPPIADQRSGSRIGMKKNFYGWQTADVVSNRDALEWLRGKIAAQMKAAGFAVLSESAAASALTYKIYLQKLFVEPVSESFSVDFEADIEMRASVSRPDGLEAERQYYEKAVQSHRLVTDFSAAYVSALDQAADELAKKTAGDLAELMRRYPP